MLRSCVKTERPPCQKYLKRPTAMIMLAINQRTVFEVSRTPCQDIRSFINRNRERSLPSGVNVALSWASISLIKAAHNPSSALYCQALKEITLERPLDRRASCSCNMNDDFPVPQSPSIDNVNGGLVEASVKNCVTAETYGLNPSLSSSSVAAGW